MLWLPQAAGGSLLWIWGRFSICIRKYNIPSRQPQHLSHLPVVGTLRSWLGLTGHQEQRFCQGSARGSSSTNPAPLSYSAPTGSASVCRCPHQTASPMLSKELPAAFLSCTGAWHGREMLGGQTLHRAWQGAHGDRHPAEAACSFQPFNRTQSSFANLPLKWLPVFLRAASVCRSAEFPP